MNKFDILLSLKEEDSYDVAKTAIVSVGTFDPSEIIQTFR
jgi:hypothetical protein